MAAVCMHIQVLRDTMQVMAAAALIGAVAGVLTTPFDVVKTRIQLMVCDRFLHVI
jgi:hypothetical protein